jgi:hypothetical protein
MKFKKAFATLSAAGLLALGFIMVTPELASAHTPGESATCAGVVLTANSYDASKANTWTATVGGVTTSGTFGSDLNKTIAVPQDGATTAWSATIQAYDGTYKLSKSGSVGPCGTPPPVIPPKPAPIVEVTHHTTTDCTAKTDTVFTDTTTTDWSYDAATNSWIKGTPTTVETSTSSPATAQECPTSTPTPTPTPTAPPVGNPNKPGPKLAYTGTSSTEIWELSTLGGGLVALGLAAFFIKRGRSKRA